ncbi:HIT domain-containing protein [Pseudomonas typographi]|uniref:HIT domain-containing protein n=1 Tax=Pseudomonas typographi TaxID=2715964 RepID=A0ABR7Z586_9PSED|nr:HIT domain-containing protein [Pseudomonas typographi]MBD1586969.1 HIT domain-containing protein [Pseudomonas typographi]MBD1600572.1 HIT domain-containing protein [Pseudomonas typographi]
MFSLDPQLQADAHVLGDFPLCQLLLNNDCQYPWLILVPRRGAVSEIFELPESDQQQLWQEVTELGRVVQQAFAAHKVNIAALGNVVRQLHVHVIARFIEDPAWPAPVWAKLPAIPYGPGGVEALSERLRPLLGRGFVWAS